MPRIRTLKPEILEDERTSGLSDSSFRLFVSMVILADDYGNVRGNEQWLRGVIWWAHKSSPRISASLRELQGSLLIDLYTVRGEVYCHIKGWDKHQRVDNAGKPRVPHHNDSESKILDIQYDVSPNSSADFREIPLDHRTPTLGPRTIGPEDQELPRSRGSRKLPSVPLPDSWVPTPDHAVIATKRGIDLETQVQKFRNHALQNDRKAVRWNHAFTNWLLNAWPDRNAPSNQRSNGMAELLDLANAGGTP